MDARFESDLAELSADGNSVMICAERKMIFVGGSTSGSRPLGEVRGVEAEGDCLVVALGDGTELRCRFASSSPAQLADAVGRLADCVQAWR